MAPSTVQINLVNNTTSSTVYAYITGYAVSNNQLVLLQSDGSTLYFPTSPSQTGSPLARNVSIALGGPNSTRTVTIPQIYAARLWFSVGTPLTFLLNPGPALVEPSVSNNSDPNINTFWDFAEFTFNSSQLFANISYVDFMSLPISLTLQTASSGTQHVSGTDQNGLSTIANGLQAQQNTDNAGWGNLIVRQNGNGPVIRALSPNNGRVINNSLFNGYFEQYVAQVYARYAGQSLTVNTQSGYGNLNARVQNNQLVFPAGSGTVNFAPPSTGDIFSCSTGPFANGNAEALAITPRLAAAFNRSILLQTNTVPDGATPRQYYTTSPTNHYSRIVHAANLDGKGYAFPYDDVSPDGGQDQSGAVHAGDPTILTVAVGGIGAHT